jgi:DNA-binding MarR family transcriptional regulator
MKHLLMSENQSEITLGVLNAIDENSSVTQRHVAKDLGVALGLVNSYLKRSIKKGFVKIRHAPANRYVYYLTPAGFSEKSRLTAEYLSGSFHFFRNARQECTNILKQCEELGHYKIVMAGASDLAEIVYLCAQEHAIEMVGVLDSGMTDQTFFTLPILRDLKFIDEFDAIIVTSLLEPQSVYNDLASIISVERIYAPSILGVKSRANVKRSEAAL